ncbi:MAG: succinylglutamate desuccinylase/aspartoacylase family protein [Gemmatimonadales bacterium]
MTLATLDRETLEARILGRLDGARSGPVLLCVGGMHGNEPTGVIALKRVLQTIEDESYELGGTFVALVGNRTALAQNVRCIDDDLNRNWTRERLGRLVWTGKPDPASSEDTELLELHEVMNEILDHAVGECHVLDLHTTSGDSPPFGTVGDTLRNRAFALQFPIPLIMGLEEHLDGTMLEYVTDRGHITLGLEGGRHDDPASAHRLEAAVWLALAASGVLTDPRSSGRVAEARALLTEAAQGLPRVLEVRHRHFVGPDDRFVMHSGYASFQQVAKSEYVADDEAGEVHTPESGLILMPLYQPLGDDGFFIAREFNQFWLHVSTLLRRLKVDRMLTWFPGVRHDQNHPGTLLVNGRTARWFALEVFHLLGYRKRRQIGDILVVARRRESRENNGR